MEDDGSKASVSGGEEACEQQRLVDDEAQPSTQPSTGSSFESKLLLSDESILALGVKKSEIEMYRRSKYQANFGVLTWINGLEQHTFATTSIPISFGAAQALLKRHAKKEAQSEHEVELQQLMSRMGDVLAERGECFVKLDTRSAKDVFIYDFDNKRMQDAVLAEMHALTDHGPNSLVHAFVIASQVVMKVTTVDDMMYMLVRSQRVYEDLQKISRWGEKLFSAKILFRDWIDKVPRNPQCEYRGFVHNNQLNALSQYYCFIYYEEIVQHKQRIQERILAFFESVKHHFETHESYVIDFYIDLESEDVLIVELNPFHSGAGACLFSWKDDRELFLNGPFEFRVLEEVPEDPMAILPIRWKRWMLERLEQRRSGNGCSLC